jgi:quercetin dioxygenase-like cupin family protein
MKEPFRVRVRELVEYQDDSVVSRTVIDRNEGTITAFSFDKGQGLSEHTTPYDAVIEILEGKVLVIISGVGYEMDEGEMIIMPANEPHSIRASDRSKMLLTMVRSEQ